MLVSNHSIRLGSLNAIVRSTLPLESKTRISPARKHARVSALGDGLTFLREHRLNARSFKNLSPPSVRLISMTVIAELGNSLAAPGLSDLPKIRIDYGIYSVKLAVAISDV